MVPTTPTSTPLSASSQRRVAAVAMSAALVSTQQRAPTPQLRAQNLQQCSIHCISRTPRIAAAAAAAHKTAPLSSSSSINDQQQDARFQELSTWLSARGGSVGSITAGDCQMGPVVVRGLVATQDLPSGTPVLSVPVSCTLQDTRAPKPYPGAPWNVALAAQLLQERSKASTNSTSSSSSSSWGPYLATLPVDCCSPLLLNPQQLQEVQYAPAIAAIESFQAAARGAYEQLLSCQQQQQQQWSWQEWVWALHMVQSRSIRLAQMGCKVMIPGIDLLNHGGSAANGQLVLGKASWQVEGEPAVCFVTTQAIAAGQQVLWSYGRRGNDDFFAYHGFVLGSNPDEDVVLFESTAGLVDWALQQLPGLQEGLASGSGGREEQQLLALAEAAAHMAAQEASAHCSSAAIPGTSSSLLAPMEALMAAAASQQQQRQQQQRSYHQDSRQQQQQQQDRWQSQLQGNGSSSRRSSSGGSNGGEGSSGVLEAAVLSSFKGLELHRRLASFRLHRPEWGAPDCPPSAPELVLRREGCVDVRVPAVLAALIDAAAGGGGAEVLQQQLQQLVAGRCRQLLKQMPTSIQQDQQWLDNQQQEQGADGGDSGALMAAVVQYRLAKKQLLQQYAGGS